MSVRAETETGSAANRRSLHIFITGSSQGIGLHAAGRLVQQGHVVYHCNRNAARCQAAIDGAGGGHAVVCDLSNLSSVVACAKEFSTRAVMLDALVLNAGVATGTDDSSVPRLTHDGFEDCVGVNHIGHFLLFTLLQPKLRQECRLVVTTSSIHDPDAPGGSDRGGGATLGDMSGLGVNLAAANPEGQEQLLPTMVDGTIAYDGGKAYKDSKLANMLFCQHATKLFQGRFVVRSFSPGFIPSSGLFRHGGHWLLVKIFAFVAERFIGIAVPVEVGGDRLVYMILSDDEEVPSGSYFSAKTGSKATSKADGFGPCNISKEAANEQVQKMLWEKSLEVCSTYLSK